MSKRKKKSSGLFKYLFVALLLVGVIGLIFYFQPWKKEDSPKQDTTITDLQNQVSELNENINNMMIVLSDKETTIQLMTVSLDDAYDEIDKQNKAMDALVNELDL